MHSMPELNAFTLKKKAIIFGFEDVLIPGKVEKSIDLNEVKKILTNLEMLRKKSGLHVVVISGYSQKIGEQKLKQYGLEKFFAPEFIFFVSKDYLNSMEEVDRKRYEESIKKNPSYKDEFFKQFVIEKFSKEHNIPKELMVYVGHDIWLEGFYTRRFSGIDFALIRSAHSHIGQRKPEEVKNLVYINRTWNDIKKLLMHETLGAKYEHLDNYVQNTIKEKLFEGTKLEGLVKKTIK